MDKDRIVAAAIEWAKAERNMRNYNRGGFEVANVWDEEKHRNSVLADYTEQMLLEAVEAEYDEDLTI